MWGAGRQKAKKKWGMLPVYPGTLGGWNLDSLSHQLLWQVLRCFLLTCSFLTCRLVMKARSALNQGSSMALSPFLFFRTFYILLPSLFYEVRKDATLICSLGSRNLGLCGWTKVFSDWKPLEILLGRGTVMEAGARKWVDKLCTIRNDLGESGR